MSRVPAAEFQLQGIYDVQDFESGDGDGSSSESMSSERCHHLNDLMQKGNTAFREHRLEQAIDLYTRANKIKPNDPKILGNRCSAYLLMSHRLLRRPPSVSEHEPLSGLDPMSYAVLALKDAEKVMSLQSDSVKSYILQANALIQLERYELARDVICSGLQIDSQSTLLLDLERSLPNTLMRRNHAIPLHVDDYECTLCLKLLYEPTTTPCGHSFCLSCLLQSMDRGNRCPLCRTLLFIGPKTCSISVTLNNIIQKNFPKEYAERKSENDRVTKFSADLLPLYVKDVIFPYQKVQLKIDEPRYRLMVRRIMEGNRRMAMTVVGSRADSVADYACEVEITDCVTLPNGGFLLEVEGRRRCHIVRHWAQDGCRVAKVEWVQDNIPSEGTAERNYLKHTTDVIADFACEWLEWAKEAAEGDDERLDELHEAEGLMPPRNDPERFSFWLFTLTDQRPSEMLKLLCLTDTEERLCRGFVSLRRTDQRLWDEMEDGNRPL